jgi:hypothetical protein
MLPVAKPLTISTEIYKESIKYATLADFIKRSYPYTYAIGTGMVIFSVQHPSKGSLKIYQYITPDVHQSPFAMKTFDNHPQFHKFGTMGDLLRALN